MRLRFSHALLISFLIHGFLLTLQFDLSGLGIPKDVFGGVDGNAVEPMLSVVLAPNVNEVFKSSSSAPTAQVTPVDKAGESSDPKESAKDAVESAKSNLAPVESVVSIPLPNLQAFKANIKIEQPITAPPSLSESLPKPHRTKLQRVKISDAKNISSPVVPDLPEASQQDSSREVSNLAVVQPIISVPNPLQKTEFSVPPMVAASSPIAMAESKDKDSEIKRQEKDESDAKKIANLKMEEARQEAQLQETLKQESIRREALKLENIQKEAVLQEAAQQELARQNAARNEALRQEAARQESLKQESLRQEALKQDAVRREVARQEAAQQELARQNAARNEAQRQEAARQEIARQESLKQESLRQDALKQEAVRREVARQEAAQQELARQNAARSEAQRQEAARQESLKQESLRQEALKQDAVRRDAAARQEAAQQELARQNAARSEAQRQEAARQESLKQESLRQEALKQDAVRRDAARQEAAQQELARQNALRNEAKRDGSANVGEGQQTGTKSTLTGAAKSPLISSQSGVANSASNIQSESQIKPQRERLTSVEAVLSARPSERKVESTPDNSRRLTIGRMNRDVRLLMLAEGWRQKVEQKADFELLRSAKTDHYVDPIVKVVVRRDGSVESIEFLRSSGVPAIDDAVRKVIEKLAPFEPLPADIAMDYDVVEHTKTWTFGDGLRLVYGGR